jgi:hypothetical protein
LTRVADLLDAPAASFECEDDFDAANAYCRGRGWTDGLPIVPPTAQRVERMLAYCDRPWNEPVAALAPRYGAATPLRVAANAVMAGCEPEYFPIVLLALEAMTAPGFNLYGVQATTHSCAPLIIVNGPVARELGINSGASALGSGAHANATIGRAVRLTLVNIGGALPGLGDMSTYGSPAKYSYCAAENEVANPWEPLHVERGFPPETSTVTVVAAEAPHNINDHFSASAEGILQTVAGNMSIPGVNGLYQPVAQPVVMFGPEHAATVAKGGYSKADVRKFLYEQARVAMRRFSRENLEERVLKRRSLAELYAKDGLDALVPVLRNPENLIILVMGGAGKHSAFIPTFGDTVAQTRALNNAEGRAVRSINDLGRG